MNESFLPSADGDGGGARDNAPRRPCRRSVVDVPPAAGSTALARCWLVVPNSSIGRCRDPAQPGLSRAPDDPGARLRRLPGDARNPLGGGCEHLQRNAARCSTTFQLGASVLPNTNIIRIDVDGPRPAAGCADGECRRRARYGAEARSLYRIYTMRPIAAAEASRQSHPPGSRPQFARSRSARPVHRHGRCRHHRWPARWRAAGTQPIRMLPVNPFTLGDGARSRHRLGHRRRAVLAYPWCRRTCRAASGTGQSDGRGLSGRGFGLLIAGLVLGAVCLRSPARRALLPCGVRRSQPVGRSRPWPRSAIPAATVVRAAGARRVVERFAGIAVSAPGA